MKVLNDVSKALLTSRTFKTKLFTTDYRIIFASLRRTILSKQIGRVIFSLYNKVHSSANGYKTNESDEDIQKIT